jgi:LysM repeat protein
MASPAALTIESTNSNSDRAALGSSLGSHRSYGTVKEPSSALTASGRLCGGYTEHTVDERDTLQGLALRYGVSVHHIQRLNNLWDSESIHSRTTLKIPNSPLTPSPTLKSKKQQPPPRMASSLQDIRQVGDDRGVGEEVKRKPTGQRGGGASYEPFQEKSIASLLTAADERIVAMHKFNEKLALKMAHLKQPADTYNRPRASLSPSDLSIHSSSSPLSSLESGERG